MALINLEEISGYVTDYAGGGSQGNTGGGTSKSAIIGAVAGSILPGLGNLIGGTLGALLGSIRTKTPQIDWNTRNSIALPLAQKLSVYFEEAGYKYDPLFIKIFREKYGQFILSVNPGEANSRAEFLNRSEENLSDVGSMIWLALMYSIQGVSTDPNDHFGITKRIEQVMNGLIIPAVKQFEKEKGISGSSVVSSLTVTPEGKIKTNSVSGFALVLGAITLGLVGFAMVKK